MSATRPRLVLVGAGHTHALVLRQWTRVPVDADVTVVADQRHSTYSGMIPGVLAGDYEPDEIRIDIAALAQKAGARFVQARVRRIDPEANRVDVEDGPALPWDVASLDVGSTLRGLQLPGVRKHTLMVRPIGELASRIDQGLARVRSTSPRVVVVGAGAAGVEIAFTLLARLEKRGCGGSVELLCRRDGLLPRYPDSARRIVLAEAKSRGITIRRLPEIRFADSEGIGFEGGHLDANLVLWATGPAAPDLVRDSPLLHDPLGFVRVQSTLEVVGVRNLFAAGDCASVDGWPSLAKAGVHAVRQAPVLEANLRAALTGSARRPWRPQRHFLSLMNFGHRRAMAVRWNMAMAGHMPWVLKDRIDRAFVGSFPVTPPAEAARVPGAEA